MKRALVAVLAGINVALLAALVLVTSPRAGAQVAGGGSDYLMVTGRIRGNTDALYVTDLGTRRMTAFQFDRTSKKMVQYGSRRLREDFPRERER